MQPIYYNTEFIDTETKGSATIYKNPQALDCSDPSAARALLRGLRVSIDGRSCWSKYLTILEHSLIVSSEGSTYRRPCAEGMAFYYVPSTYEDSDKDLNPTNQIS